MKIIIKILAISIAFVSLFAVAALFTKDQYTLKREIVINVPCREVFDFIKMNRNQKLYSKWLSLDPNTKINLRGAADGTPGSILAFESKDNKAGKGEWEIKEIVEEERIGFELRFLEPFEFIAHGHFLTESLSAGQTKVTWVYHGGMNWPMNIMLLFMDMDKLIGKDIYSSLVSLKTQLENS